MVVAWFLGRRAGDIYRPAAAADLQTSGVLAEAVGGERCVGAGRDSEEAREESERDGRVERER